jgi:hypothetical protein
MLELKLQPIPRLLHYGESQGFNGQLMCSKFLFWASGMKAI